MESYEYSKILYIEPNIYHAELHEFSTKLGFFCENPRFPEKYCPCCGNSVEKKQFPLFCSNESLRSSISFSYYIFLKLIKKIIKLLMIPYVLIVTIPHLILLWLSENTKNIYLDRQCADVIYLFYMLLFVKIYIPFWLNKKLKIYHNSNKSISFLTISVRNLPEKWLKDDLKSFLQKKTMKLLMKPLEIEKIVAFKHCEAVRKIQKKIQKCLIAQRKLKKTMFSRQIITQKRKELDFFDVLEEKFQFLNQKIKYYRIQTKRILNKTQKFQEYAYVILKNSSLKKELISKWPGYFSYYFKKTGCFSASNFLFKKKLLKLKSAPDSNDLIVENLSRNSFSRILLRNIIIIGSFGIMAGFYSLIYWFIKYTGLKIGNQPNNTQQNGAEYDCYRILGSLMIISLNKIIEKIFLILSKIPKFETFTDLERFSLNLIGFFQFLNTFVMTFINFFFVTFFFEFAQEVFNGNVNAFETIFSEFVKYFTTIFIFIMLIPLAHFINIMQFYRFFLKWRIKSHRFMINSQKKLNKIFENVRLEIIDFYFDFNYIYLLSVFMWPFYPIWIFLSIGALFMLYWAFKFLLLRVFTLKKQRSERTFFSLINMIRKGPFLYALGLFSLNFNFLFDGDVDDIRLKICTGIVMGLLIMEFFANYVIFCNSKVLRGMHFRRTDVDIEEVRGQEGCYNLFESMDVEEEVEEDGFHGLELIN